MRGQSSSLLISLLLSAASTVGIVVAAGESPSDDFTLQSILEHHPMVVTLEGASTSLAELLNAEGRPVVITFWATWCSPCRKEVPHLSDLSNRFKDAGLKVIGLTVEDPNTARDQVRAFMREQEVTYPIAFASESVYRLFNREDATVLLPRVFVFDGDGRLVAHVGKYYPRKTVRDITDAIKKAVGGSGASATTGG